MGLLNEMQYLLAESLTKGSTLVPIEVREKRKDICYGRNGHDECKYVSKLKEGEENRRKCTKCKCFIELKAASETHILEGLKKGKIEREVVTCPMQYWEEYFKNLEI